MRWKGRRRSTNVEDRRGRRLGGKGLAGGGLGMIAVVVVLMLLGVNPGQLMGLVGGGSPGAQSSGPVEEGAAEAERRAFLETVLADTETVWRDQFQKIGRTYEEPTLVWFRGQVQSACGFASAASGPFYCPADHDQNIYMDMSFFDELARKLGAPGDFAQAYVLAHEVGHHIQKQLGISDRVRKMQQSASETRRNQLSVRMELQADFLAGVWAHHAQRNWQVLEAGDLEEAIQAAEAIGDDRLQKRGQGYVVPDSFTHGTSAQRMAWFRHGYRTGDMMAGDTFDEATFRRVDPE